jgi:gamma-tubulin complex component 3
MMSNDADFQLKDSQLETRTELEYQRTAQLLRGILFEKYHLGDHLMAFRKYLLLGQGDFIQHLMDSLRYVLIFLKYLF